MTELFELNPGLDTGALAAAYRADQRLQVRDLLTERSAGAIHDVLTRETPWGLAWKGANAPTRLRREEIARLTPQQQQDMTAELTSTLSGDGYGFLYSSYPMLTAYLDQWAPGSALDA